MKRKIHIVFVAWIVVAIWSGHGLNGHAYAFAANDDEKKFPNLPLLQLLMDKEIVRGDAHGDYALERTITRAEWLTLLRRVVVDRQLQLLQPAIPTKKYAELEHHWAKDDLYYWIRAGVIVGDSSGNIRPDDPITLAEVFVILDRISMRHDAMDDVEDRLTQYKDHWAYPALNRLYERGWLQLEHPIWYLPTQLDRLALRGEGLLLLAPYYTTTSHTFHPTIVRELQSFFDRGIDMDGDGRYDFSLRVPNSAYTIEEVSVSESVYARLVQKDWDYRVYANAQLVGELHVQVHQVNKKDLIYFLRYTPTHEVADLFTIELLHYGNHTLTGRVPVSKRGEEELPYAWREVVLENEIEPLTDASMWLTVDSVEMRLGATDTYTELGYDVRNYANAYQTPSSLMREDYGYRVTYTFTNKPDRISETWGILAKKGLLQWDRTEFAYFMQKDDMSINKKLTIEGLYYRTPNTYVPRTASSFYLNPANIMGVRALALLQRNNDKGRFIEDFVVLLGHMAVKQQNKDGFWATAPKSQWLEREYGTGYTYYDNRRNADNATFLLRLQQYYPDSSIQAALNAHVHYLYYIIDKYSIPTSDVGILFTDYTDMKTSKLSHVSLNHHLAVVNFLLDWYSKTDDAEALDIAMRMIRGIEDTEKRWIKANNDLYYALYANLAPHPYPDYVTLTLTDLEMTQLLLLRTIGITNDSLGRLITAKEAWLAR